MTAQHELESADRLVRFWDGRWTMAAHLFHDLPSNAELAELGAAAQLTIEIPRDHPLISKLSIGSTRWHLTIPRTPFAWVLTEYQRYGRPGFEKVTATAQPIDTYLRSRLMDEQRFLDLFRRDEA